MPPLEIPAAVDFRALAEVRFAADLKRRRRNRLLALTLVSVLAFLTTMTLTVAASA